MPFLSSLKHFICFVLFQGVEEFNNLSFNLAAHIHTLGPDVPTGNFGQSTAVYDESEDLIIPADVTASGYYITNLKNFIVGNAASGVSMEGRVPSKLSATLSLTSNTLHTFSCFRAGPDLPSQVSQNRLVHFAT